MTKILQKEASQHSVTEFVRWMLTDAPAEAITKACQFVFPMTNIVIRKVKMLKKAKLDSTKLDDLYKENIVTEKKQKKTKGEKGEKVEKTEDVDPSKNLLSA